MKCEPLKQKIRQSQFTFQIGLISHGVNTGHWYALLYTRMCSSCVYLRLWFSWVTQHALVCPVIVCIRGQWCFFSDDKLSNIFL